MKLAFMSPVRLEIPDRPQPYVARIEKGVPVWTVDAGAFRKYIQDLAECQKRGREIYDHVKWTEMFNPKWFNYVWNVNYEM